MGLFLGFLWWDGGYVSFGKLRVWSFGFGGLCFLDYEVKEDFCVRGIWVGGWF